MVRIAIVEDDVSCMEQLRSYVERYGRENGETLKIDCFPDALELVEDYRPIYDLLLLDIKMPRLDGMTAARKIRQVDEEVLIVFITNMAKYAINGYEVEALGFMLKPVNYFSLTVKLRKAMSYIHNQEEVCLILPGGEGDRRVPTKSISFIEVLDHRLHYHTAERVYIRRGSLQKVEKELEGCWFARCNKCYLVNLRHIQLIKKDSVVLTGGDELLISRRKREEFLTAVTEYYGKGGR